MDEGADVAGSGKPEAGSIALDEGAKSKEQGQDTAELTTGNPEPATEPQQETVLEPKHATRNPQPKTDDITHGTDEIDTEV